MSKKIYITQDQLNEIINNGAYLDDASSDGNVKDPGYMEITTNPIPGGEPVTSDEFGDEQCKNLFMGRYRSGLGVYPAAGAFSLEEKKNINEVADGVKNKKYKPSGQLLLALKANMSSLKPGDMYYKVLKTLLDPEGVSENYLSNLLSDMESGKVPQEKIKLLAGPLFIRWGNQCITNRQTIDANFKKSQHDMGMENVYQKAGGTRNNGGTAHTKKNGGTITYFN